MFQTRFGPVEGSEPDGTRPAVVVSHESLNQNSPVVTVVPLSSRRPGRIYLTQVVIPASEPAVDVESVAKCEQVRAVATSRFLRPRGSISASIMAEIDRALLRSMALVPRP